MQIPTRTDLELEPELEERREKVTVTVLTEGFFSLTQA